MKRVLMSLTLALVTALAFVSPVWAAGGWGNDGTRKLIATVDNFKIVPSLTKFGLQVSTETLLSGAVTTATQAVSGDLNLGAAFVGASTAASPEYFAGVMGNVIGTGGSSGTKNIFGGVIGKFDVQGTISSTYPAAAVVGELGDKTTGAYANFLAVVGGDTGTTTGKAAFSVDWHSSTAASALDWFLDSQGGGTHDSYFAPRYAKGDIRLGGRRGATSTSAGEDVCISRNAGRPTDGSSGTFAGDCAGASILIDTTNKTLHYNVNTKASPTWISIADVRTEAFAPTAAYQPVAGDLNLTAAAGSSTAASPAYLAGVMGNVLSSATMTATQNIFGGVIGKHDQTGTQNTLYASAGVIGEVGDGSKATYGVLAALGGDTSATTTPTAMFGVAYWNSTVANKAQFGLDLQGIAHTGYMTPEYSKGDIRLGGNANVLIMRNAGAPVNGTTGANNAGPGTLLIDTTNAKLYINTNTLASPTWTVVGSQS